MKIIIILLLGICISISLIAQNPLIKIYINDGSTKEYNIEELDSIDILHKGCNYVLRIHYQDTSIAYYPTEIIGSIKVEKNNISENILNIYIYSYPKSYLLSTIDSLVFYIDEYQPLTICNQVWMQKNLNVDHYRNGDPIPQVNDPIQWINLTTGAWCYYNNDPANGEIYGKLYNWYAVNDPRGLAPDGWHVPTDEEWKELETYLGGSSVAGGKLKSTGTIEGGDGLWYAPNNGATNESGFSALPGGELHNSGVFSGIGEICSLWSATECYATYAWERYMDGFAYSISRNNYQKEFGISVRCLLNK